MAATKKDNKLAIGKGIGALLQSIDKDLKGPAGNLKTEVLEKTTSTQNIPLDSIVENPKQPRKDFDPQALAELAESIKQYNLIQPLTVSKLANGKYQLIAGERRLRASRLAGLKEVPVFIREANDQQLLELALLENLQRENLNAIEIALSYSRLMEELSYTQEQVAERMGKDRTTVTNYLRLLKLPPDIQNSVRKNQISFAHAKAMVSIEEVDKQLFVFKEILQKSLSAKQTEDLIKKMGATKNVVKKANQKQLPPTFQKIQDKLSSEYSAKVKLNHNAKGYGSINFEYYSIDELNSLLEKFNINV